MFIESAYSAESGGGGIRPAQGCPYGNRYQRFRPSITSTVKAPISK
jgi:hypothetical protein